MGFKVLLGPLWWTNLTFELFCQVTCLCFSCNTNFVTLLIFASFTKPRISHVQHQQYFINSLFNIFASASSFITIGSDVVLRSQLRSYYLASTSSSWALMNIGFLAGDELSPSCIQRTVVCLSSWSVCACLCLANTAVCLLSQVRSSVSAMPFVSCKHYTRSCVLVTNYLPLLSFETNKKCLGPLRSMNALRSKATNVNFCHREEKETVVELNANYIFKLVYCTWISCRGECTY